MSYMSEKPQPTPKTTTTPTNHHPNMMITQNDYSTPFSPSSFGPKKRAETWLHEETRALITFRTDLHSLFNTSKSNKHLWDQISMKMRDNGFDRSPSMCTDKWRNLLKDFKKANTNAFAKEFQEIFRERCKANDANNEGVYRTPSASKLDSFMQFSEKGLDDTNIMFGPVEATADAVAASGVSPWNWRGTPGNGEQNHSFQGRVITVKWGDYVKRVGIDGTADAIKEAIKSAFRLRTKRAFWLEDEYSTIRTLDRDMPLGNYILHVDEGLTIKICMYEEPDHLPVHTEDKTFYTEDDFRDFLSRHCWTCLREYNNYRNVDNLDELCPGVIYRGVN